MKLRTFFILFLLLITCVFASISKAQAQERFNLPMNKDYMNELGQSAQFMIGYPGFWNGEAIIHLLPEEPHHISIYIILVEMPQMNKDSTEWITNTYEVDRIVLSHMRMGRAEVLRGEDLFIKQVEFFTIKLEVEDFYTEEHNFILRNGNLSDIYR